MNDQPQTTRQPVNTSPLLVAIVWAVVTIPALWGVSKTVQTSLKLFQTPTAAASQPAMPATNTSPATVPTTLP